MVNKKQAHVLCRSNSQGAFYTPNAESGNGSRYNKAK